MERAKKWMDALRANGITVTSTWCEVIASVGVANPRETPVEQKLVWCLQDLKEVCNSRVFWLLMPSGAHSFGATFEFASFVASKEAAISIAIVSGDYKRSIFTSFAECVDTDEEAFDAIVAALAPENKNADQPEG
jgi:hypothetical protein